MKTIMMTLLCLVVSSVQAADKQMTINVKAKDSAFEVTLPANPTTGYQWTLQKYDKTLVKAGDEHFLVPQSGLMGASGFSVFNFQVKSGVQRPASTTLVFRYARSWEPGSARTETVTVRFAN